MKYFVAIANQHGTLDYQLWAEKSPVGGKPAKVMFEKLLSDTEQKQSLADLILKFKDQINAETNP